MSPFVPPEGAMQFEFTAPKVLTLWGPRIGNCVWVVIAKKPTDNECRCRPKWRIIRESHAFLQTYPKELAVCACVGHIIE